MKQKITLEIQNDTGLEFEERGEYRPPQQGEYFIADYSNKIECAVDYFKRKHYIVLTPKIDHELESAKKKFPVGSWVKHTKSDGITNVTEVVRFGSVVTVGNTNVKYLVGNVTPFPLPTWRCCETDKPEKSCSVITRHKLEHSFKKLGMDYVADKGWESIYSGREKDYEWLDEGEL